MGDPWKGQSLKTMSTLATGDLALGNDDPSPRTGCHYLRMISFLQVDG